MEGFFLLLGIIGGVVMALIKICDYTIYSWLACGIPLLIAVILVVLANGGDLDFS